MKKYIGMVRRGRLLFGILMLASMASTALGSTTLDNTMQNTQQQSQLKAPEKNSSTQQQKPIVVKAAHPTFAITLKANPTTGYTWFLKGDLPRQIKALNKVFHAPDTHKMGAAGYETWFFKMSKQAFKVPHMFTITLIYAQPWQLSAGQVTTFTVVTTSE